jgi:hypothetical protein
MNLSCIDEHLDNFGVEPDLPGPDRGPRQRMLPAPFEPVHAFVQVRRSSPTRLRQYTHASAG